MAFVTTVFARPNGSGKTTLATAMRERLAQTAIFPDTYNRLADLEADVLVTHEAPGCHRHGFDWIFSPEPWESAGSSTATITSTTRQRWTTGSRSSALAARSRW